EDRLVTGPADLEEDPVLPLELDLLVVDPTGEQHDAIEVEELGLLEAGGGARARGGASGHPEKMAAALGFRKGSAAAGGGTALGRGRGLRAEDDLAAHH